MNIDHAQASTADTLFSYFANTVTTCQRGLDMIIEISSSIYMHVIATSGLADPAGIPSDRDRPGQYQATQTDGVGCQRYAMRLNAMSVSTCVAIEYEKWHSSSKKRQKKQPDHKLANLRLAARFFTKILKPRPFPADHPLPLTTTNDKQSAATSRPVHRD